ncbi:MAG: hypothetical protein NVS3B20_20150 [Polyangiales bacterium]
MADLQEAVVSIAASPTPIAKEYRLICDGIERTKTLFETFDTKRYDARAVSRVRAQWLHRMGAEHRSVSIFSSLAAQLIEANATIDAKVVMLRMAQDELRHTETCGRVVAGLGGVAEVRIDVSVAALATHRGCSSEERALRNVLYTTCLSEMVAVARLVDELDSTKDEFLRDASRRLLADEVLHGQFGFHYLEAWKPWLDAHPAVVTSLAHYLQHAFAVLESALAGPPVKTHAARLTDDERALGVVDPASSRDIFYHTLEGAVVPGIDRFGIDASRAWKERRLLDRCEASPTPV